MDPLGVAALAFLAMTAGGLGGLALNPHERYLSDASREAVRFMQGTVGSMAALVLGLLVASASDHYRGQSNQVGLLAGQVLVADRLLSQYGPEAAQAREALRASVEFALADIWAERGRRMTMPPGPSVLDEVARLHPEGPRQAFAQTKALEQLFDMTRARAALTTAEQDKSVQPLMLAIVVLWFVLLFFSMGAYARLDRVSATATFIGSWAVASAVFVLVALDNPFEGVLAVSDTPLRQALAGIRQG